METVGDFLTSNFQQSHFRVRKEYVVHSIMEYHAAIEKAIMFHEIGCRTAVPHSLAHTQELEGCGTVRTSLGRS